MIQLRNICLALLLLPGIAFAQMKEINIRLHQDEKSVLLDSYETHVKMSNGKFKIQVYLQNVEGVYLFASFNDSIYRLNENEPIPGFADLPNMAMAEETYNKDKELLISDEGWSYWFYDPDLNWHRFNEKIIKIDSGAVVGTKTIKFLYFVADQKSVKLKNISDPLYLFFVATDKSDENASPKKELLRRKVKIEWTEED
ncbi:MAG TPA: hypothetical protein PKC72_16960 [Chitinophagaceae bacterium]|nr:hypothetical protein [Chitinophagaceae bacterium]